MLPELIRGHPSPHGFDLCGTALGTVALDAIVTGAEAQPGDAIVGLPSSGLHSNGYTLARRALLEEGGLGLDDRPALLEGRSVADALLEPTVIYVRAVLDLLRSDIAVNGLAHITGGGLRNLLRLGGERLGFAIEAAAARARHLHAGGRSSATSRRARCGTSSTWAAASSRSCPRRGRTKPPRCSAPATRAPRASAR